MDSRGWHTMAIDYDELNVLTGSSLNALRDLSLNEPELVWNSSLLELGKTVDLQWLALPVKFDGDAELKLAAKSRVDEDVQNSLRVSGAFEELSPATALDERIWATLAFGQFKDYVVTRWPMPSAEPNKQYLHISNKLFAPSVRIRTRDHAIGRLWWAAHYAERMPLAEDVALRFVYDKAEIISQLMGRPNLFNNDKVLQATINVLHSRFESGVEWSRSRFRDFTQGIDLLAGGLALGTLDHDELEELIQIEFDLAWS